MRRGSSLLKLRNTGLFAVTLSSWAWSTTVFAADVGLAGSWVQGPLKEEFTIQLWVDACGPKPVDSVSGGGESITITEDNDELLFLGGNRKFRTTDCYDPLPTLARESHSRDLESRQWRSKCSTPAGDPRVARINTLVQSPNPGRIQILETGRYEVRLREGHCVADIRRQRTLERKVQSAPAPAPSPSALTETLPPPTSSAPRGGSPEPSEVVATCNEHGPPVRLDLTPRRKVVRPGQSFSLRAVVSDARGCTIADSNVSWSLANGAPSDLAIDGSGHLSVGKNTPDGRYEVAGEAGSLRALAVIEVASANRYDDLLRQETIGINEPPPSTGIESGTANLGVRTAQGEDLSKRRRNAFILIVIGVPAIVAALALLVGHRFRRSAISNARESGDGLGNTLNLSGDRGPSRPQDRVRDADAPPPVDASRPVAPVDEGSPDNRGPKGKICPACGERYDASASFCGKDGASLVLLN